MGQPKQSFQIEQQPRACGEQSENNAYANQTITI